MQRIAILVAAAVTLTGLRSTGEEISSRQFKFGVTLPDSNGWEIATNGPIGKDGSLYIAAAANKVEFRSLAFIAAPLPTEPSTGRKVETVADNKEGFEKGFLKKADAKVSSTSMKIDGYDAYQIVALKTLPNGESRHVVGITFFANGYSYSVSAATKIPFDKDDDLRRFIESIRLSSPH
jgi:hypothetical protein